MSLANRLRVLVVCVALEIGVLGGVPMRPDEIESLMREMNQPTLAHVLPTEDEEAGGSPTGLNGDEQFVEQMKR
jgi:hypothetical protein